MRRVGVIVQWLGMLLATGLAVAQPAARSTTDFLLPESALADYERDLDHAGLIRELNAAAERRGERIYQQVCHSCHGDANLRGSLPEALSFAHDAFKRGGDPHALYQTITRGWGLMAPQVQLVPQEKYDVIHFIRQNLVAPTNKAQLFAVTPDYLAGLPTGKSRGPAPAKREPWREMDYGDVLMGTFEVADEANRLAAAQVPRANADAVAPGANIAQKGIAIRLDRGAGGIAAGKAWVVFEHDTARLAGAWTGEGFIDWDGINFNTRHVVRPRTIGELHVATADTPAWANPATGKFDDERIVGADGRRFGPLPREWVRYRGLYRKGDDTVISYTVGETGVLEAYALESETVGGALRPDAKSAADPSGHKAPPTVVFVRTLNVGRSARDLTLRVANVGTAVARSGGAGATLASADGFVTLRIPARATPLRLSLRLAQSGTSGLDALAARAAPPRDLAPLTKGGPAQWSETLVTPVVESDVSGAFAWSRLALPLANPWKSRLRTSGIDFVDGGKAAVVCCWDGDVWRVEGIDGGSTLTWRRIASGLFQPLGIKVRDGVIYVTCRDQLVALRDLNGDGETDFYECVNSDHQVTEHFHEFAMGLQTDAAGNFYYAKSARHARTALVPQHGTLLKIAADGSRTEILANGFRAANGVCLNPDGSFFVTDQEGHWMPMNRINRVVRGGFYGNLWSGGAPTDESDAAMALPVCWVDKAFDRSPSELVRVEGKAWGALEGKLLNFSYGFGRVEVLFFEENGGVPQGALCALPMPAFPTGIMRGRFHPRSGELFICGLSAWATSMTQQEGGLYRLRPTGRPAAVPVGWRVQPEAIELTFSDPVEADSAARAANYEVKLWDLRRSANYGSPHIGERALPVASAQLSADRRSVRLALPGLVPAQGVRIVCRLRDADGRPFEREINGTIHRVPGAQ